MPGPNGPCICVPCWPASQPAVNVLTEPAIRWAFKTYILGLPESVAWISAVNCAVAMAVNAIPSAVIAALLYGLARTRILKEYSSLTVSHTN